jgi:hypothetical protein
MNVTMVQEHALMVPGDNNTFMECANANKLNVGLFLN